MFRKKKKPVPDFDVRERKKKQRHSFLIAMAVVFLVGSYSAFCLSQYWIDGNYLNYIKFGWYFLHPNKCFNSLNFPFVAVLGCIIVLFTLIQYDKLNNTYAHGEEHGTAKWGSIEAFNQKYEMGNAEDNRILSEHIRFSYDPKTLRNGNIFCVGGSGAGKTSFFLIPNLLNCHGSNVYTDAKGDLFAEFGKFLANQPHTNVYVVNLCDMKHSMKINPFRFIKSRDGLQKLISNLIANTNSEQAKNSSADPFWEKSERLFLESLFLFIWMDFPRNIEGKMLPADFSSVMKLLDLAQIPLEGPAPLDSIIDDLSDEHPAKKVYQKYLSAPDDTRRSILMSVNARMQPFDNDGLLSIFSGDDIPLDEIGVGCQADGKIKTKSDLFLIVPDNDTTYNFVPGMIYTLLIELLYDQARQYGGRLPIDVGFWLDEFANTKMPDNFDKFMATCRSRGIYAVPILQSLSQMKTLFKDGQWEGIVGNCDTFLYLGGNESSTFEYLSKLLGEWTMDKKTSGESKGNSGSTSSNSDVLGRKLMQEYEVRLLPDNQCLIFVRGEDPLRDTKWYPWEHQEYAIAKNQKFINEDQGYYDKKEANQAVCEIYDDEILDRMEKRMKIDGDAKVVTMSIRDFLGIDFDRIEPDKVAGNTDIPIDEILKCRQELSKTISYKQKQKFLKNYEHLKLPDIYASKCISETRKRYVQKLLSANVSHEEIKDIINPNLSDSEVEQRMLMYEAIIK